MANYRIKDIVVVKHRNEVYVGKAEVSGKRSMTIMTEFCTIQHEKSKLAGVPAVMTVTACEDPDVKLVGDSTIMHTPDIILKDYYKGMDVLKKKLSNVPSDA